MEITKKNITGKLRTVGTLEINWESLENLDTNGQPISTKEKVEILKLTFGEDLRIRNNCTKVKMSGGQPNISIDQEKMTIQNLKKSIILAPFEITEEGISDLDKLVAAELLEAFNNLNVPQEKKNTH